MISHRGEILMWRKLLAVILSGAWLFTSTVASASQPASAPNPPPATTASAPASRNTPPLPPGGALDIHKAQGYSDLGFGVILLSWIAAGGLIWLIIASTNSDNDNGVTPAPTTTGTH